MGHLTARAFAFGVACASWAAPLLADPLMPAARPPVDMTMPRANVHSGAAAAMLPPLDSVTNPQGYEAARDAAAEIARDSAGRTLDVLTDLARQQDQQGKQAESEAATPPQQPRRLPEDRRATVLVSAAMGEGELKRLFAAYAGRPDVRFAFRGVPPGSTVPDFAYWLQQLLPAPDAADVTIDPEIFALAATTVAPTTVIEDLTSSPAADLGSDMGKIVVAAQGHADPDWIWSQVAAGQTGLNRPTGLTITEEDLRVRAEREFAVKMAGLTRDPAVLIGRFWDRQSAELNAAALPPATLSNVRPLEFAFVAPEDITDADGRVLAFKGERFEPADVLPFDRQMLVIDPTDPQQVEWAARRLKASREGVTVRMVVLTRVPPPAAAGADPWSGIEALIQRFGVKVFLINPNLRAGFDLRVTPTEIFPRRDGPRTAVLAAEGLDDPVLPPPGQKVLP